jgi:chaperonin GroEL
MTIAKEFDLKDPEENRGVQMIRQAAGKTGDSVGDGTSTATVPAHAIFAEGLRNVVAGARAVDLKRGTKAGAKAAIAALRAMSRLVKTRREKAQVATISAHNDPAIGDPHPRADVRWRHPDPDNHDGAGVHVPRMGD